MDYLEYKGYKGSVEYSKEDNCLFGKVQGMSKALILYEGQTLDELRKDFEEGIDSYIEGCKADGIEPAKPYSGKLNLRMSSELHSKVAAFVASTGITINDFINKAIKNELTGDKASAFYEGKVEPFAIQFSEVISRMIYSPIELNTGNRLILTANRVQFMTNADKLNVSAQMADRGIMTINEIRDIWNLAPVEGGNRFIARGEYYFLDEGKENDNANQE